MRTLFPPPSRLSPHHYSRTRATTLLLLKSLSSGKTAAAAIHADSDRIPFVSKEERHLIPDSRPAKRHLELSATELASVRLALKHNSANKLFCGLRLRGPRIDVEDVRKALKALQWKHPLLRHHVVRDPSAYGGFLLEEDPETMEIPVIHIRGDGSLGENTFQHYYRQDAVRNRPLEFGTSPSRIYLFENHHRDPHITDLAVDLHHHYFDGTSLPDFLNDFLGAVVDPSHPVHEAHRNGVAGRFPKTSCKAIEETIMERRSEAFGFGYLPWYLRRKALMVEETLKHLVVPGAKGIGFATLPLSRHHRETRPRLSRVAFDNISHSVPAVLDADTTRRLKHASRIHGCSLTTVVTAAHLQAIGENLEEPTTTRFRGRHKARHMAVTMVADARTHTYFPISDMCYHTSCLPVYYTPKYDWEGMVARGSPQSLANHMWEVARGMREHVEEHKGKEGIVKQALVQPHILAIVPVENAVTLTVSSWGAKSVIQSRFGKHHTFEWMEYHHNLAFTALPLISMFVQNGRLTATFAAPVPRYDEELLVKVSGRAKEILDMLAES